MYTAVYAEHAHACSASTPVTLIGRANSWAYPRWKGEDPCHCCLLRPFSNDFSISSLTLVGRSSSWAYAGWAARSCEHCSLLRHVLHHISTEDACPALSALSALSRLPRRPTHSGAACCLHPPHFIISSGSTCCHCRVCCRCCTLFPMHTRLDAFVWLSCSDVLISCLRAFHSVTSFVSLSELPLRKAQSQRPVVLLVSFSKQCLCCHMQHHPYVELKVTKQSHLAPQSLSLPTSAVTASVRPLLPLLAGRPTPTWSSMHKVSDASAGLPC